MSPIELIKHPSHTKRRKRLGRGISSGHGKTSGRGQNGQGARSGGSLQPRREGGRMPIVRQFPKYAGFKHHSKITYHVVNLESLQDTAEGTLVDLAFLEERSLLPKKLRGLKVKLLGVGPIAPKLTFRLHAFSHAAKARVEQAGGTCEVIE